MTLSLEAIASVLVQGGLAITLPLALFALILFYSLGCRAYLLGPGLVEAARCAIRQAASRGPPALGDRLEEAVFPFRRDSRRFERIIQAIVRAAPLLGLLGTVSGMIETFESMAEMALFSQTGGVAGGIAEALITTELGLLVAVPGLLAGRLLDRRAAKIEQAIDRLRDAALLEAS